MTTSSLDVVLATTCIAFAVLLIALIALHLLVIRPRLARSTYLTVVRVIEADLARDELDGAVRAQAPAVFWLHGQLTRQCTHPGLLLERREVCEEENGVQTARLVRGYVSELLEAQLDYRATGGRLIRSGAPRPRHMIAPRRAGAGRERAPATVGSGVGATVGSGVGATVGTGVGATVGSAVGTAVAGRAAGDRPASGRRAAGRGIAGRGEAGPLSARRADAGDRSAGSEGAGQVYVAPVDSGAGHHTRIDLTRQERGPCDAAADPATHPIDHEPADRLPVDRRPLERPDEDRYYGPVRFPGA